jgi:hypothetical protein
MNNSVHSFFFILQSVNFQGRTQPAKTFFLNIVSFANLAANLALADNFIFSNTILKISLSSVYLFFRKS